MELQTWQKEKLTNLFEHLERSFQGQNEILEEWDQRF